MEGQKKYISEFAIASLVIGALSFIQVANMEKAAAAMVFGVLALRRIGRETGARGKGLAIAGIVLGCIAAILIVILFIKFWPELQQARQQQMQTKGQ